MMAKIELNVAPIVYCDWCMEPFRLTIAADSAIKEAIKEGHLTDADVFCIPCLTDAIQKKAIQDGGEVHLHSGD